MTPDTPRQSGEKRPRRRPHEGPTDHATELRSIVVRYDGRPDYCTITPATATGEPSVTAWISADIDVFVDLEQCR